jgi:hypothetical protein
VPALGSIAVNFCQGTSKNPWFFEETIGTWMCQPKSKLQSFDFEEKRKRRFSFFVRSKNPGGVFRDSLQFLIIRKGTVGRVDSQ